MAVDVEHGNAPLETRPTGRATALWLWVLGLAGGAVVLGPGLGPGTLLNLDLVLPPRIEMPPGVWGLGPALPRNFPFVVPLSLASYVVGGPITGKLVLLGGFALAFVGAARLIPAAPFLTRVAAGALYAFNPFMLTRAGVGHLTLFVAAAVLPWALPTLLRPADDVERTFLWSLALGVTGFIGAVFAAPAIVVGLVADRGRRWWQVAVAFVVAQLPWAVAGTLASSSGVHLASADYFTPDVRGLGGYARVLAGFGFWDPGQQISLRVAGFGAVAGVVLLVLAVVGTPELPAPWARRGAVLAATGFVVALGTRVPLTGSLLRVLQETLAGQALRESQRLLPLYLVWLAPAAAAGARRLARVAPDVFSVAIAAAPLAIVLVLAGPGLWGLNGRLEPASFPSAWARAKQEISAHPGTVLALPFSEYIHLDFAHGRLVLNPAPAYFGGDVVYSSDPELGAPAQENADPREPSAHRIVDAMARGSHTSDRLARLGIRWVLLLHEDQWREQQSLRDDRGLHRVVADDALELFEVRAWSGPAQAAHGRAVDVDTPIAPVALVDEGGAVTWFQPATRGWLRGFSSVGATRNGLLRLGSGGSFVWYWPATVAVVADLVTVCALAVVIKRIRRRSTLVTNA